jgi:hypothetical protein
VLVGVVAPLVFSANFDLAFVLVARALLLLWRTRGEACLSGAGRDFAARHRRLRHLEHGRVLRDTIYTSRNFYGSLRVQDSGATTSTAAAR